MAVTWRPPIQPGPGLGVLAMHGLSPAPVLSPIPGDHRPHGRGRKRPLRLSWGWRRREPARPRGTVSAAVIGRQLAGIRAVLAAFDWEHSDRQLALEEIERITTGGEV